jgi:hypothetical protein
MSPLWKVLLGLALALPMAAYVASSLVASGDDEPVRRDPVIISDAPPTTPPTTPPTSPRPGPTTAPGDADDEDDDEVDDNEVRVVTPKPTRVDDDDDGHERDDDSRDDSDDGGDD